jgi:hypothetical protein
MLGWSPPSQAQQPTRALIYALVGGVQLMKVDGPPSHSAIKRMCGHKLWSRGSPQLLHSTPNPSPIEGALPAAGSSATKSAASSAPRRCWHRIMTPLLLHLLQPVWSGTSTTPLCLSLSFSGSRSMNTMSLFTPNASIYSLIYTYSDLKNSTTAACSTAACFCIVRCASRCGIFSRHDTKFERKRWSKWAHWTRQALGSSTVPYFHSMAHRRATEPGPLAGGPAPGAADPARDEHWNGAQVQQPQPPGTTYYHDTVTESVA